jgi:hypothetical protein
MTNDRPAQERSKGEEGRYEFHNFCVAFLDLLGQRDAMRGEGLLPIIKTEEERQQFILKAKQTIGSVAGLQRRAENLTSKKAAQRGEEFREKLSPEHQVIWDDILRESWKRQRWSDGLVYFASLGESDTKCKINDVYTLMSLAGALCLIGLGSQQPVRGAIDMAWGIELHPGELYGPALAHAYELESEVAKYPRIVVSERLVGVLASLIQSDKGDFFHEFNRELAKLCLSFVARDKDGVMFVHYLGKAFQTSVTQELRGEVYRDARKFVEEELVRHRQAGDQKLADRYVALLDYFVAFPPLESLLAY